MGVGTKWAQGDSLWSMTKKLLDGFNSGAFVGGGGGGGGGGAVTVADGADVTQGSLADAVIPPAGLPGNYSAITILKSIYATLNGQLAVQVFGSLGPVSGNVGGLTYSIQINPTISTAAYSAGFVVGGIQTLTNAFTAKHTGILESVTLLDKSAQNAPMDLLVFQVTPAAATTADHGAFAWSTDNLNLIARVSIMAGDYVAVKSQSIAMKTGLGIVVKGTGTGLFVVAVTSGTPTYAGANDLQWTWGILQD